MQNQTLISPAGSVAEYIRRGYTSLEIDFRKDWGRLYRYFRSEVLAQPNEVKTAMEMDYSGRNRPDHGLYRREDTGGDWKWIFHYRPWDKQQHVLDVYAERGINIPGFAEWCVEIDYLAQEYVNCLATFFREVDRVGGWNLEGELLSPSAMEKHVVRFIYYDPNQPLDDLASTHNDFSLGTFPCYETDEGLWLVKKGNLYKIVKGKTLVFAGRKSTLSTNETVPGVCHGVIKTPKFDSTKSRGSVVFFAHGPGDMGPSCPS